MKCENDVPEQDNRKKIQIILNMEDLQKLFNDLSFCNEKIYKPQEKVNKFDGSVKFSCNIIYLYVTI